MCHILSENAIQVGLTAQEKEVLYELVVEEVGKVPNSWGFIVGGVLNGHTGSDRVGFEEVKSIRGFGAVNREC